MQRPKVAFFDLNHTVLQMTNVPGEEIAAYLTHIKQPRWEPLILPKSWAINSPWNDAIPAIHNLRTYKGIRCVTLSNNPIHLQVEQTAFSRISWDFMVPLESYEIFKPNHKAYSIACSLMNVDPQDALMVTANKDFGDIEGATSIGMPSVWIDRKNEAPTYSIKSLMDLVAEIE